MKTVRVLKNSKDFELYGGFSPGTVRVSSDNSKAAVILGRCAIFRAATALCRIFWSNPSGAKPSNLKLTRTVND
jgi:hypothetical protein